MKFRQFIMLFRFLRENRPWIKCNKLAHFNFRYASESLIKPQTRFGPLLQTLRTLFCALRRRLINLELTTVLALSIAAYKKIDDSDLPGLFDYRCRYSIATSGCTVSAFDEKEAEELCDFDSQCQAFVISSQKTWTGRQTV